MKDIGGQGDKHWYHPGKSEDAQKSDDAQTLAIVESMTAAQKLIYDMLKEVSDEISDLSSRLYDLQELFKSAKEG